MEKLCKRKAYEIISYYYKNVSSKILCSKFSINEDEFNSLIKSILVGKNSKKRRFIGFTYDIVTMHEKGIDNTKIGRKYLTSDECIRLILKNYYEDNSYESNSKLVDLSTKDVYKLVNMFYSGMNFKSIMEEFNIQENEIYDTIDDFFKDKKQLCGIIHTYEMVELHEQGVSRNQIAEKFLVSPVTVKNRIDEYYANQSYIDDESNLISVNKSKDM